MSDLESKGSFTTIQIGSELTIINVKGEPTI